MFFETQGKGDYHAYCEYIIYLPCVSLSDANQRIVVPRGWQMNLATFSIFGREYLKIHESQK